MIDAENRKLILLVVDPDDDRSAHEIAEKFAQRMGGECIIIGCVNFHDIDPPEPDDRFRDLPRLLFREGIAFDMPEARDAVRSLQMLSLPTITTSQLDRLAENNLKVHRALDAFSLSMIKAHNSADKIPVPKSYQRNRFKK